MKQFKTQVKSKNVKAVCKHDNDLFIFISGAEVHVQSHSKCGMTRPVSICSPHSVEKHQPKPLCTVLPSSTETCTVYEVSQSFTSISRSHETLATTVHTEPDGAGKHTLLLGFSYMFLILIVSPELSYIPHETFVLQSCWPASSATHWTVSWPL